jgi:hypothetical protein
MDETNVVLTKRDERNIEKEIALIRKELLEGNTFTNINNNGESALSPETIESVIAAFSYGIRQVTIDNKKYTPKKYRK